METLLRKDVVPPDGFRYFQQETRFIVEAQDYWTWVAEVKKHRIGNGISLDGIEEQMQDQLCQTLPAGWCRQDDPNRPRPDMRFGLSDIWNWAVAHIKLATTGFVAQEEAERRAKICAGCYMNVMGQGCQSCHKVAELFTTELAARKTESDSFLRNCAACKCYLKALVHFPIDILQNHASVQPLLPSFCWQKVDGVNYL